MKAIEIVYTLVVYFFGFAVLPYLIGSIPFGLILTRLAGLGDIRAIGSGNIGATNVLRTGNKKLAALTLFCDAAKGFIPVFLVAWLSSLFCLGGAALCREISPFFFVLLNVAGLCVVLGHMFPVWLKFKGGKGVATSIGVIAALHWPTAVVTLALWIPVVFFLRISSLATLIVTGAVPVLLALFGRAEYIPLALILIALIFFKHRANIRRLMNHTEPKIGSSAHAAPSSEPK